ncbi:uncharacterized protein LOC101852655 [Aplysia californica]|uniref:Uncharacterized protein LOC101852655 n=1 Tax=Aplysia californica TaxID=6500 RepID=A0ABM0K6Y3_APLCA|nr:uncharacterized protein LOC101852655 [Aplysia californica]XP_005110174.1 uncharacterized protein LOC101852655 [Aplysia californica]XP_005110176.1 uncharacterized protein LOC101852655 [Aplysia californica]
MDESFIMIDSDSGSEALGLEPPAAKRGRGKPRGGRGRGRGRKSTSGAAGTSRGRGQAAVATRRSTRISTANANKGTPLDCVEILDNESSNDGSNGALDWEAPMSPEKNNDASTFSLASVSDERNNNNNNNSEILTNSVVSRLSEEPIIHFSSGSSPLRTNSEEKDLSCDNGSEAILGTSEIAGSQQKDGTDSETVPGTSQAETVPSTSSSSSSSSSVLPKLGLVKKTTKRGLAKKTSDLTSVSGLTSSSSFHDVYSKPVEVHKFLYDKVSGSGEAQNGETEDVPAPTEPLLPPEEQPTTSAGVLEERAVSPAEEVELSEDESFTVEAKRGSYAKAKPVVQARVRSPTPPPTLDVKAPNAKKKRLNKKLTKAFNALVSAQVTLNDPPVTPIRNTRRGRKSAASDIILVEEESPQKIDMVVKVRFLSKVHRIKMKLIEPFQWLVSRLSEELGEEEHELSLFLQDKPLLLKTSPKDIGLTVADIIECYCIAARDEDDDGDEDAIDLYIQCSDRRTRVMMRAKKRLPLSDVMQRYATRMGLDESKIKFSFDGEDVNSRDTPDKLDMDSDDVLDAVVLHS